MMLVDFWRGMDNGEADVPATEPEACEQARISCAHGDPWRAGGAASAQASWSQAVGCGDRREVAWCGERRARFEWRWREAAAGPAAEPGSRDPRADAAGEAEQDGPPGRLRLRFPRRAFESWNGGAASSADGGGAESSEAQAARGTAAGSAAVAGGGRHRAGCGGAGSAGGVRRGVFGIESGDAGVGVRTLWARLVLALIRAYRRLISPLLPPACRFFPSCSAYAEEAVTRWGGFRGSWLAARRLARCHPFGGKGYDPVP